MSKVFLKKNEDRRIRAGHLWVFSNEIAKADAGIESGDIVTVYDAGGQVLGKGFYNKNSLISVRLLGKSFNGDLDKYINDSVYQALKLRKTFYPDRNSFRLVFSESDFLPGLIIDKYNDTYVLQVYCFGIEKNMNSVIKVLKDIGVKNIFTNNEPYFRKLEGLPEEDKIFFGGKEKETIDDGSVKYFIDFEKSQKTGFFFDQCDNREFTEKIIHGKNVLDAFCNSGGFGLHSAKAGAGFVTFVDSSKQEIENANRNFKLNDFTSESEFVDADIFTYLERCVDANRKFDVVMVDPPAFAKSRKSIPAALKGYVKLNKLAISCVGLNGYLVSSSCSHHVTEQDFLECINSAAAKSGKQLQLVHLSGASIDHPVLPSMKETEYLKFAVFRVF